MKKVKWKLSIASMIELDRLISGLTEVILTSCDMERCVIATMQLWQSKKLRIALANPDPAGHSFTIEVNVAYALRSVLEYVEVDPHDELGNKLLRLADDINKVYVSPLNQFRA